MHDIRQRSRRHELFDRNRSLGEGGSGRSRGECEGDGEGQSEKDAAPICREFGNGGHGRSLMQGLRREDENEARQNSLKQQCGKTRTELADQFLVIADANALRTHGLEIAVISLY